MAFEVRTSGDPVQAVGSIREAVRQVDPNVPLMDVSTRIEQIERRFSQERVFAQAYALFGGLALLVASIGLFGLMSYSVTRRTNEIGIRMALGDQRPEVVRMIITSDSRDDQRGAGRVRREIEWFPAVSAVSALAVVYAARW